MAQALRRVFAEMYEDGKALERWREQAGVAVELPPVPRLGTLDLAEVRKAAFFFA